MHISHHLAPTAADLRMRAAESALHLIDVPPHTQEHRTRHASEQTHRLPAAPPPRPPAGLRRFRRHRRTPYHLLPPPLQRKQPPSHDSSAIQTTRSVTQPELIYRLSGIAAPDREMHSHATADERVRAVRRCSAPRARGEEAGGRILSVE
eukprot:6191882-Pleurochrysis_carterae.AAC.2